MNEPEPWYMSDMLLLVACACLALSLIASHYGLKVAGELEWGSALRVFAAVITIGRTIAKKQGV